jgi:hypothetical protein
LLTRDAINSYKKKQQRPPSKIAEEKRKKPKPEEQEGNTHEMWNATHKSIFVAG